MRFSKPLLVAPFYSSSYYHYRKGATPPIGLGYIAENLCRNGIEYDFLDMSLSPDVESLLSRICAKEPDIIGISLMTFKYKDAYQWITQVKARFPHIPICLGGPHVSSFRAKVLEECPAIDFAVVLEGEETFLELCNGMPLDEIQGLIFRDKGAVRTNGERPLKSAIDDFHFPTFKNFDLHNYSIIGISTSRGCPYQCIFCESSSLLGKKFRARSAASVVEEFTYWYNAGYHWFSLYEDNFVVNRKRVHEICRGIKEQGLRDIRIEANNVRADNLSDELLRDMYAAGFRSLCIGVESGSDKVLKVLKKGENTRQIRNAIRSATALNYEVKLYFIVGSPEENWRDFKKSIRLALRYPVQTVKFYSAMPIPGTELYELVRNHGRFLEDPAKFLSERNPFYEDAFFDYTPGMTVREKKQALRLTKKIVHRVEFRYRLRFLGSAARPIVAVLFLPGIYYLWAKNEFVRHLLKRVKVLAERPEENKDVGGS